MFVDHVLGQVISLLEYFLTQNALEAHLLTPAFIPVADTLGADVKTEVKEHFGLRRVNLGLTFILGSAGERLDHRL